MVCGVYEIKNDLNNYRYIGSSINIHKRWKEHLRSLNNNCHHSLKLQRAWNKYGQKIFKFNILETCEPIKETILFLEQKYLDLKPEYNICTVAGNTMNRQLSLEGRAKISRANKTRIIKLETREKIRFNSLNSDWNKKQRKAVSMVDPLTNKTILRFDSICQAALYTGHINHRVSIKRVLANRQSIAYGHKWVYTNDL